MIKIEYGIRFLKDLKKIEKLKEYNSIKTFCFSTLEKCNDIFEIRGLKKIKGHSNYYRIRIGDYRVGLKIENQTIYLIRVLHRKEIYKYFPQ